MSKPKEKRGGHPVLGIIILVLILLILAAPWLYLRFTDFPYDDWEAMAAGNEAPFDYVDFTPEAELTVRLDKPDLYALLQEYAPPEKLLEQVPAIFGTRPELEKLGVNLRPDAVRLSLCLKLLGFLSLPLQLRGSVEEEGDGLRLTPTVLYIGPLVHISADKLADFLHMPDLARGYVLLPADYGAEGVTLRLGTEEARLSFRLPPMLPDLLDLSVSGYTEQLEFYGVEEYPAASAYAREVGFAAAFRAAIRAGTPKELLASYLAVGDEAVTELLAEYAAQLPEGILPDPDLVAEERAAAMALWASGQRKYESLLENLREMYKGGELTLVPGGFQKEDRPLTFTDLGWTEGEPEAWRIVYLYNYSATHQAATADMPAADTLPHTEKSALPEGGVRFADLGLILPFPQGQFILMYRTAQGELVLNRLPEDYVQGLLASAFTPTLRTDDIPGPPRWVLTPAPAEDLMPVYRLEPEE